MESGAVGHNFEMVAIFNPRTIPAKSSSLKPLNQIKPNPAEMVLGRVPFTTMSGSPALHSRWLQLKFELTLTYTKAAMDN